MRYSLLSNRSNWMSCISDAKSIAHISIPGTHDSCARKKASGQTPGIDNYIATQWEDCTITKQLEDGIRYLDIRCCAIDGVFTIHHGDFYLNITFGDVLNQCISFLESNSSETILMRIKQESSTVSDYDFIKIFNTHYAKYHKYMYLKSSIPNLGEVRGKIVILANVRSLPGISYSSSSIQDDYSDTTPSSKRDKIENHIRQSAKQNRSGNTPKLYLNYCNATNPPWVSPESFANSMLPYFTRNLKKGLAADIVDNSKNEAAHIGIIVFDFYSKDLVSEVIKRNENRYLAGHEVISIYNTYYGKHYFYSSLYLDGSEKRRQVFDWESGERVANGFWMLIPDNETHNNYYIFNTYYKEFLYASTFVEDNRRTVYTWVDGVRTAESKWYILNNTIYNDHYSCYLYESSLSQSYNRKIVPCWAPGVLVSQCKWYFETVGTAVE